MFAQDIIDFASNIIRWQRTRIKKRIRKNRTRLVYRVQNDAGFNRLYYNFNKAIIAANQVGGRIYQGKQKYNWINSSCLTGIHYNKKRSWQAKKTMKAPKEDKMLI